MYRPGSYIAARIAGLLVVLIMAASLAVQTPFVQSRLAGRALESLKDAMDGRIQYGEMKLMPSGALLVKDVLIIDSKPYTEDEFCRGWEPVDTVFRAGTLTATFSLPSIFKPGAIRVGRVIIDDGLFHLVTEPRDGRKLTNIQRVLGLGSGGKKEAQKGEIFSIGKLRLSNFRFRLNNFSRKKFDYGESELNYDDLDIRLSLEGHGVKMADGRVTAALDRLQFRDKCGYQMRNLTASCSIGPGKAIIRDIHLTDSWSDIRVKYYSMTYADGKAFRKYNSQVLMEGEIESGTLLSMHTLSYFTRGAFRNSPTLLSIGGGHVRGYVNDLSIDGLTFNDLDSGVSVEDITCSLTGLPKAAGMMTSVDIKGFRFTPHGVGRLAWSLASSKVAIPENIGKGQHFTLDLKASGPVNRLKTSLSLASEAGRTGVQADIRNLADRQRKPEIKGQLSTSRLNLGTLLGEEVLGICSVYVEADAALTGGLPQVRVDSLRLDRLDAFGYRFRDISARGSLLDSTARLSLASTDPNFRLRLDAAADLPMSRDRAAYSVDAAAEDIDLNALAIDTRTSTSRTSFTLRGSAVRRGWMLDGNLAMQGIRLTNNSGEKNVGDIEFKAYTLGEEQCYSFDSPFAEIFLSGSGDLAQFAEDVRNVSLQRSLPSLAGQYTERDTGHYDLDILMHDSREFLSYAAPGLYIADSTRASMSLSSHSELLCNIASSRIAFGTTYLKDVDLQLDNLDGTLNATVTGQEFKSGRFDVTRPDISLFAENDAVALAARFDAFSDEGGNGEIFAGGEFYRDSTGMLVTKIHPLDSYISAGSGVWDIGESDIVLRGNDLYVNNFRLSNGGQYISVDGGVSRDRSDTLTVGINRVDLSQLDEFLPQSYGIRGTADGKALLTSQAGHAKGMLMDLKLDSLYFGQAYAGNLQISGILADQGEDIDLYIRNELDGRNALYATGMYFLDDGRMDLSAELDRLPLASAGAFMPEIFSKVDGSVSGSLRLQGLLDNLTATSRDLTLNDAQLRLAYTGVPYTVSGPLSLDSGGIHFDSLRIRDDGGGSGEIEGSIYHEHLRNFRLDAGIRFNSLKLMDSGQRESGVYGKLKASGSASVRGPFSALSINAVANTEGDGSIHLPLSGTASVTQSDLLTFTRPEKPRDPYEEMVESYGSERHNSSDPDIQLSLSAHPGVKAYAEIDKSAGNVASFSGEGKINLHLRPSKAIFDINGDFSIREGNYQFVIPGILSKDFSIEDGSSIKFGGDIADTELDINVLYSLRASLNSLIADKSSSVSTKRQVECGIAVTDRLRNPQISFSINVPDLDPTTKAQVDGALSTDDKVQKQFMALLLMGTFIPDENSGVVNGSEILVSNVTELMSNQLNSILQKLEIPVDVGIGYQGAYQGTNMFDVAISTQLFNDRVIVGGSVANRKYNNTASAGDMVGDFDIQIKLDDEGRFRLNLFSHSADEYTSYLDLSQRNGVGVSYQKEYGGFRQFWRSLLRRSADDAESGETTIKIESDEQRETVSDPGTAGQ